MSQAYSFTRAFRTGWLWLALALLTLGTVAACATRVSDSDQAAQTQPQEQPQGLIAATYSGGNACEAQARQGCNSCQVSCPSDRIAYCAPGNGYQVLSTGGIYEWRCTVGPTCTCTKPN